MFFRDIGAANRYIIFVRWIIDDSNRQNYANNLIADTGFSIANIRKLNVFIKEMYAATTHTIRLTAFL